MEGLHRYHNKMLNFKFWAYNFVTEEIKTMEEQPVFSRSAALDFGLCQKSFLLVMPCQHNANIQNSTVTDGILENGYAFE